MNLADFVAKSGESGLFRACTSLANSSGHMKILGVLRTALLAAVLPVVGCTNFEQPSTVPVVTTLAPLLNPAPEVGGMFQGTMALSSVSGGTGPLPNAGSPSCVQEAYKAAIPPTNDVTLVLTQSTTTANLVTGRLTSASTGLSCAYTGSIGSTNGLVLDAGAGSLSDCTGRLNLQVSCLQADGTTKLVSYELEPKGASLTGTFDGWPTKVTALRGRAAVTYNVSTGEALVINFGTAAAPFVLTKQ